MNWINLGCYQTHVLTCGACGNKLPKNTAAVQNMEIWPPIRRAVVLISIGYCPCCCGEHHISDQVDKEDLLERCRQITQGRIEEQEKTNIVTCSSGAALPFDWQ